MSLFPQPSRSLQPSRPPRSSSSSHSRSLFEQVLESSIEDVRKDCTSVEKSSSDMSSSSSSGGHSNYNGGSCNNILTGGVDLMIK